MSLVENASDNNSMKGTSLKGSESIPKGYSVKRDITYFDRLIFQTNFLYL